MSLTEKSNRTNEPQASELHKQPGRDWPTEAGPPLNPPQPPSTPLPPIVGQRREDKKKGEREGAGDGTAIGREEPPAAPSFL